MAKNNMINNNKSNTFVLSSHQPNFLPYMGFFYKAYKSDIIVMSTDVTYSKKGRHNYNNINSSSGTKRIGIPVSAHHDTILENVIMVEPEYNVDKLCKTLMQEYSKAEHYECGLELINALKGAASNSLGHLSTFNISLFKFLFNRFEIKTKIASISKMKITGHKDDRIIEICKAFNAPVYLSGDGAKVYHEPKKFEENNIELRYTEYSPVTYKQKHGGFTPNLSVADYVFNQGYKLPEEWTK